MLNQIQKEALRLMDEENLGAVRVMGFGWVWPTDIRNDKLEADDPRGIEIAYLVAEKLSGKSGEELAAEFFLQPMITESMRGGN